MEEQSRRDLLFTKEEINKIENAKIAIFGLGGVGAYVFESLVRMGIKYFTICDGDKISLSNLNRQILATKSTIGKYKTEVARLRALDINPDVYIDERNYFYNVETSGMFNFDEYDYIIDCIDSFDDKMLLIKNAQGSPFISSTGTGNRTSSGFVITTIDKTSIDPLAKKLRLELRKIGITKTKVLCSTKETLNPYNGINDDRKRVPGSVSYVVGIAGLMIAEEVIKDILSL